MGTKKNEVIQARLRHLEAEINAASQELQDARVQCTALIQRNEVLTTANDSLQRKLAEVEAMRDMTTGSVKELENRLSVKDSAIRLKDRELKRLRAIRVQHRSTLLLLTALGRLLPKKMAMGLGILVGLTGVERSPTALEEEVEPGDWEPELTAGKLAEAMAQHGVLWPLRGRRDEKKIDEEQEQADRSAVADMKLVKEFQDLEKQVAEVAASEEARGRG